MTERPVIPMQNDLADSLLLLGQKELLIARLATQMQALRTENDMLRTTLQATTAQSKQGEEPATQEAAPA